MKARGRPKLKWVDGLKTTLKGKGRSWGRARELALGRARWRPNFNTRRVEESRLNK